MGLDDKVFVVTGAGQGIGEAYANALAADGALVAVADINLKNAQQVAEKIAVGGTAKAFAVDVADPTSCQDMVDAVAHEFGGIDGLVNNAATFFGIQMVDWLDIPLDYWQRILATNLTSVLLCTRAVAPYMKERGGGKIVNQASIAAFHNGNHYCLTKRGVVQLTGGLAKELGQFDINVNAIAPGAIDTEAMLTQSDGAGAGMVDYIVDNAQVFHRRGTPQDLVGTLLFLCSSASDWVTGQTIIVDGGTVLNGY